MNPFKAIASWWGDFFDKRLWQTPIGGGRSTVAMENVSEDSALNYSAVWCATRLLCGTGASMPFPLFRGVDSDERVKDRSHPVYRVLNRMPNREQTALNFRSLMWQWIVNWGNGYAEIEREGNDPDGELVALWPLHPARVEVCRDNEDELYYKVRNENMTPPTELDPWQMFHVPSIITADGIVGHGVIQHARESIGVGIAAEKYGAHWFGGAAVPRVVIEHDGKWKAEARDSFGQEWDKIYGAGPDGRRVAVLEGGAKAKALSLSAEDSQFLETRQFGVEEISRWYGIPPHLLEHLLHAHFNNVEQLGISFVQYSLIPWLRIWEQCVSHKLLTERERETYFAEHNVDALLRGDSAARASFYATMTSAAIMTRNECRKKENLDPVDGGDTFLIQGAMVPLDEEGKPVSEFAGSGDGSEETGNVDTAGMGDVQATALNGAQIVALLGVVDKLSLEELPQEGVRAMIEASFPSVSQSLIDRMVNDVAKFAKSRPKPAPVVSQNGDGKEDDPDDSGDNAAADSVQRVLEGHLSRILTKESKAMANYAKKPRHFVSAVDAFYDSHFTFVRDAVNDTLDALEVCGRGTDREMFVSAWVREGKALILEAAGTAMPAELAGAVGRLIDSKTWSERPKLAIERANHATIGV